MDTPQLLDIITVGPLWCYAIIYQCVHLKKWTTETPQPQPQNTAKHKSCGKIQQIPRRDMHVLYLNPKRMLHAFCNPTKAVFFHDTED